MGPIASDLGVGVMAFIATNIDDIFLLAAFFSDPSLRTRSIVAGQYLGMGLLILASILVAALSLAVPDGWVALLGIFPLVLGLKALPSLWSRGSDAELHDLQQQEHTVQRGTRSQVLAITAITLANGGDNVGVYVPLFARDTQAMALHAVTFLVLTGLLCVVGHRLVNNALMGNAIRRRAHVMLPIVLILLGVYILSDAWVLLPT